MVRGLIGRVIRALARAPIRIFRAGYGFLFGQRLVMLQHTGRRSGLPRYVVLEVVRRLPGDRYLVPAGSGPTADWYRNVQAEPRVLISVGTRRQVPAQARGIDQAEAVRHLIAYKDDHRWTWAFLRPLLVRLTGRHGQSDEEIFAAIPLVELDPNT